jgi:hypothetical protein
MNNPDENIEQDVDDLAEQNVETNMEAQEDYSEDMSPNFSEKEDLYSLFWKTINIKDSSKVGNLDSKEIGMLDISVRDCQQIAQTAVILDEKDFAKWMTEQGQIILRTSSSKRGYLLELFVTAKRFVSKEKRLGVPGDSGQQPQQSKTFWEKIKGR